MDERNILNAYIVGFFVFFFWNLVSRSGHFIELELNLNFT